MMPQLSDADLSLSLDKKDYRKRLRDSQHLLFHYQRLAFREGIPVVLVFEGWDASGKGGVIKRLTELLDPRGFHVHSTAAPTQEELAHHYLWRFWSRLPSRGGLAIFDRSWYGRVMVERIEGFCTEAEWQRAYDEINAFEAMLANDHHLIAKFFLHFDQDTQLERFEARRADPLKSWKLTDEDWRNREKWPQYEAVIQDMLDRTHTDQAPWSVIPSVSKRWARVAVLENVIERLRQVLGDIDEPHLKPA